MTTSKKEVPLITRGYLGIPKYFFEDERLILNVKRELTFTTTDYMGNVNEPILLWEEDEDYIYVPRHYHKYAAGLEPEIAERIELSHQQDLIENCSLHSKFKPVDFDVQTVLKEERGQVDAYKNMVRYLTQHDAGILQAFTGCGKTILGLTIASYFRRPIGVFVYNEHMLHNWIETAKLVFGYSDDDIGIVQGPRCDIGKPVTIMMVQSLYTKDHPQELYDHIGFVLADEINRYGCEVWQSVVSLFKTPYRLGMSADPRRKDGLDRVITYNFGAVGHVVPDSSKKALPTVYQVEVNAIYRKAKYLHHYGLKKGKFNFTAYKQLLAEDDRRNRLIVDLLLESHKQGRKCLIFSHLRDHVTDLYRMFYEELLKEKGASLYDPPKALTKELNKKVSLLMGGTENITVAMKADFIFTTYSFARDALNLPHVDTLFLTSPCGDPLQPVGRLRDAPGKKDLIVVDLFELNDSSLESANKRRKRYESLGLTVKRIKKKLKKKTKKGG